MNKAKRRAVIAGNWKMNKNRAEAKALITELLPLVKEAGCEVVICTPYTNLETALALTEGSSEGGCRELSLGGKRSLHWGDLRADAEGAGGAVCHHRTQRAPAVLWRDR